jgi:L-glyceraldehyde reductase
MRYAKKLKKFSRVLILIDQVEIAVRNGYRHLDLAMIYENQDEVGAALKKVIPSVVKREELFITSKCWNSAHQPAEVEKELDETLKQLGIDYVDLYRGWYL